jgi:multicomponent Na+:H+ antiporter subunit D
MITVGAYAVARWWWVVFSGAVPMEAMRHALVGFGVVTAVVGAVMCAMQRHLKRLLAYSTVAHSGVLACGIGLLSGPGLAAAGLYAVGHACAKGALFMSTGILLNRFETLDEHELWGRGTGMRVVGGTFLVGALSLAGLPPLGTWAGKASYSSALAAAHAEWLEVVILLVAALTGGSVLRAWLRVFVGAGPVPDPGPATHEEPEGDPPAKPRRLGVLVPPIGLLVVGLLLGTWPGVADAVATAAAILVDRPAYDATVLHGAVVTHAPVVAPSLWSWLTVGLGLLAVLLASAFAAASVWLAGRSPAAVVRIPVRRTVRLLHEVHRAHVGDYVSWVLVGFVVLGAVLMT